MRMPEMMSSRVRDVRLAVREELGPWAKFSFVGMVFAAVLAVWLGSFIPRQVEQRFEQSQMEADQAVLDVLTTTEALVAPDDVDIAALDRFVEASILRGDFVRVKVWGPDGTIVYSDDKRLVGRRFEVEPDLELVFREGETVSAISDLSAEENELERFVASELLETYIPVESDGQVVAVWEVYHSLDRLHEAVASVRTMVWLSVGSGLAVLGVFMIATFGNLVAAVQRRRQQAERRSRDLQTMLSVARAVSSTVNVDQAAEAAVGALVRSGGFQAAALESSGDGGTVCLAEIAVEGSEVGDANATYEEIVSDGPGRLTLRVQSNVPLDRDSTVVTGALEEARLGIERARLLEGLEASEMRTRALMEKLVSAQEEERMRIVGEVHDGVGQDIHRVLFGIRGCTTATPEEVSDELLRLESIVEESSRRLRRLLHQLHPSVIEHVGLAASLRSLARSEDSSVDVVVDIGPFHEPDLPVRLAAFRIAQEAVRNVDRHSTADRAVLSVFQDDGELVVRVEDAGVGFDPEEQSTGLGLWLMKERAESVGGALDLRTGVDGTLVEARLPGGAP